MGPAHVSALRVPGAKVSSFMGSDLFEKGKSERTVNLVPGKMVLSVESRHTTVDVGSCSTLPMDLRFSLDGVRLPLQASRFFHPLPEGRENRKTGLTWEYKIVSRNFKKRNNQMKAAAVP